MNDLDKAALRRVLRVSETNFATNERAVYSIVLGSILTNIAPGFVDELTFYNMVKDAVPLVWFEEETFRAGNLDMTGTDTSTDPLNILMDKYIVDDVDIAFLYAACDALCFSLQGLARLSNSLEEIRETVNEVCFAKSHFAKEV